MNKVFERLAKLTIVALAVSLLSPMPSATSADETVTKTFVVRDYNNNLVQDALVRVWWSDPVKGEVITTTPIATTDANGTASITLNKSLEYVSYQVFPKSGDVLNAAPIVSNLSTATSETIQTKFRQANLKVEVKNPNGTSVTATDEALIGFPSSASVNSLAPSMVLRSGAFGIYIPQDLSTTSNYQIGLLQYVPFKIANRFSWRFGLKASGTAGNLTYTVYTDAGYTTVINPDSNGVYSLDYKAGNITGKIKDLNGNAISLPEGVRGFVSISPEFTAPINSGSAYNFNRTTSPDATWYGRVEGPAGKYRVDVRFDNTIELPSFSINIWKNSAGGFSLSESGPFTSAPHTLDLRIPGAANLKLKVKTPGANSSALGAIVNVTSSPSGTFISSNFSQNGEFAAVLPNGSYVLNIIPNDSKYASFVIGVVIAGGVATVTQGGGTLTPVSGFYEVKPLASNFKFRIVSDTSTSVTVSGSDINITKGSTGTGEQVTFKQYSGSDVDFYIADGTYTIKVGPGNKWNTYGEKTYPLTVSGGTPSVTGASSDGTTLLLSLKTKNLPFKIVSAANSNTGLQNAWVDYCKVDSLDNPTNYSDCFGYGGDSNGLGAVDLANGLYILNVNPGASSSDARQSFKVSVASNAVTSIVNRLTNNALTLDGTTGRYLLAGSVTNVQGTLKLSDGNSDVTFAQSEGIDVQLQKWNASRNSWDWTASAWRTSATYGFTVPVTPAAKYRVLAKPFGMPNVASSVSAEFETNGTTFVAPAGASVAGTPPILSGLKVSMKVPNFKIRMVNPIDDSLMKSGWIAVFKKESNGNQTWIENMDMTSQSPGLAGTNLADGNYRLELNPQSGNTLIAGLARVNFDLTMSGGVATVSRNSVTIAIDNSTQRFVLKPARSNVSGRVVNQAGTGLGNGNGQWVNINIQKWREDQKYWEWTQNWANADKDGFFNMSVSDAGKYRLRLEPNGFGEATVTYSNEFTISAGQETAFSIDFGPIKMSAPALKVQVLGLNSTTVLQHIGIQVRKAGQFIDWAGTGQNGVATISFSDAGSYELLVFPNTEQVNAGASSKSYSVTAVKGSDGVVTASITGVTPTDGVHKLTFAAASLQGFVYQPGTTTGVQNAQVVAVDSVTLRELWEYSTNTSATGKWAMSLPAGTYKIYARAPWGSNTYGNSAEVTGITVADNGTATVSGGNAAAVNLQLSNPRWFGTVRTPDGVTDAVIPYATICLYTANIWTCTNANEQGAWAMSAPAGFDTSKSDATAFSANAILEIRDDRNREYPMLRFNDAASVFGAIGVQASGAGLTHRLKKANFKIQVTANGKNVPNIWVSADANNIGWLGGGTTNASGIASFYIDTATVTSGDIRVRAEVSGNKEFSSGFSATTKSFAVSAVIAANGNFSGAIPLDTPNFRGILREPTVSGTLGNPVPWSWVQLFDESTGNWITGTNTDENGVFTMNIPPAASGQTKEYTVLVQPRWDSNGNSSRRQYTVIMDANGIQNDPSVTAAKKVYVKGSTTPITVTSISSSDHFVLSLAAPNVKGTVVNPSNVGVQDSWVVPINALTGEYLWQQGMHSVRLGSFAMNLSDGNYKLEANVPWNVSDLAKASQCSITVNGGVITTAANGGCVEANGTLKLSLRAPNVTFTLKNAGVVVPYAHVSLSVGNWWTGASANKDGKVSLFVDRAAILAANPSLASGTHDIRVWVDPPYGSSDLVRWDCASGDNKPLCSNLVDFNTASEYGTIAPFDVAMPQPNTKLRVVNASSSGVANSWVSIFKFETTSPNSSMWIGGANTDSNGYAALNVDSSTATANTRYRLEVNPPWDQKAIYSQKWYGNDNTGLTLAQINGETFTVGVPNLKLTVQLPSSTTANKWGWVGLIEVDSNNAWVNWAGGFGLDNLGITSITLQANKRYRLEAHPASGRPGAKTECLIQTNGSSVVSKITGGCSAGSDPTINGALNSMTITLNAGNLIGTIKDPSGNLVAGAIVYINVTGAANETLAQTTVTSADGKFGFTVDGTKSWDIKVFPANTATSTQLANGSWLGRTFSNSNSTLDVGDLSLGLKS